MIPEPILIVGQNTLRMLTPGLTPGRFRCHFAENSTEALLLLGTEADCSLCIFELDADPGPLLELLSSLQPALSVLFAAESYEPCDALAALRAGATDVILGPAPAELICQTLERALEHSRHQRQLLIYRQNMEQLVQQRTDRLRQALLELERSYDITLEAMGDALDLRDEETEGHSKRVTAYTIALARALRLTTAELKTIARGAFLHDVGKIAIPDSVLLKPGQLSLEEMTLMRTHCERGYRIVRKIPFLQDAAEIVYAHQEKFDGTGYPRGLHGEEIPLGARIFALADALDAMTSDRPYRAGMPFTEAIREIERCRGTQFDPQIVDVFLSLPEQTWATIRSEVGRNSHASELVRAAAA